MELILISFVLISGEKTLRSRAKYRPTQEQEPTVCIPKLGALCPKQAAPGYIERVNGAIQQGKGTGTKY